jgi:hypothetical protein
MGLEENCKITVNSLVSCSAKDNIIMTYNKFDSVEGCVL